MIYDFFRDLHPVFAALIATIFTWLLTAMGSALVFFFKKENRGLLDAMLGFTGGVMIAASFWSLLSPAIELSEKSFPPHFTWIPAASGFLVGALTLFFLDKKLPHLHINFDTKDKDNPATKADLHNTTLLILAITLHNIPEGLAVGILFGATAFGGEEMLIPAITLAIGIGIQNFPEGFAVSMPLRRLGVSRFKSFWYGQLSAIVEPIAGVVGALTVVYVQPLLPYALAFAAGAMVYVAVEEVIPATHRDRYTDLAILGFILGFIVMMILDVGLG